MDEIMSTAPNTTTSTPTIVDELIKFYVVNTPNSKQFTIKPLGAFKESPHFIAKVINGIHGFRLIIISNTIFRNDNINILYMINDWLLVSTDLKNAINEAVNIIRKITFCKVDGEFKKENEKSYQGQLDDILNRLWDRPVDLDCCVCKDATNTKTACGHRLCLICWSNINGLGEKEKKKPRCPMCRENITFVEKYVDSDDSD
jgi:hypothetical protein